MRIVGIYKITNMVTGRFYIGQSRDIRRRSWDHRCLSHEMNLPLKRAMLKYGKDAFKFEILEECPEEQLDEREIYYITTLHPEYNCRPGGQKKHGPVPDETKRLLSQKGKESWTKKSDAEKEKVIKKQLTGPRIGHSVSDETKEKLRNANIGKKQSVDTIEKRRKTMAAKYSAGYMKDNSKCRKPVRCIETDEIFESVKDAAERFGIRPTMVSAVLRGRQKKTAGYHFEYWKV